MRRPGSQRADVKAVRGCARDGGITVLGRLAARPSVGYQGRSVGEDGMRARSIIGWSGLFGLLWSAAAPAQTVTLSFSHFLGPTSFFQEDVVVPWAQALEAKTGGKLKVEIHHGG